MAMQVFGYVCVSRYADEPPAESQAASVRERATEIDGEFAGFHIEHEFGPEAAIHNRPELQAVLGALGQGDHLVTPKLTTIATNPKELAHAIEHLATHGVHLHTTSEKADQLDLTPAAGEALIRAWQIHDEVFATHVSLRTRASLREKKSLGQSYCCRPPIGQKRVVEQFGGKTVRFDIPDFVECDVIREIYRRKTEGETFVSIARDFCERKLKKANRRRWVKKPKQGKQFNTSSIRRAYWCQVAARARGTELDFGE